jgi:hypothetical protein
MQVIILLREAGFDVTVVFDPPSRGRHHSKCASIERAGKRENARITAFFECKVKTMKLAQSLEKDSLTNEQQTNIQTELKSLEKKVKSCDHCRTIDEGKEIREDTGRQIYLLLG